VLAKGRCHGFSVVIPTGGQTHPIPTEGETLTWKKAQKKEKKNITSETINKTIPSFKPCWTFNVCQPIRASIIMSQNQTTIKLINMMKVPLKT
jgi:hypothetical protein